MSCFLRGLLVLSPNNAFLNSQKENEMEKRNQRKQHPTATALDISFSTRGHHQGQNGGITWREKRAPEARRSKTQICTRNGQ
jgi:hypothetical protein